MRELTAEAGLVAVVVLILEAVDNGALEESDVELLAAAAAAPVVDAVPTPEVGDEPPL